MNTVHNNGLNERRNLFNRGFFVTNQGSGTEIQLRDAEDATGKTKREKVNISQRTAISAEQLNQDVLNC
jgi:hypothetical protein